MYKYIYTRSRRRRKGLKAGQSKHLRHRISPPSLQRRARPRRVEKIGASVKHSKSLSSHPTPSHVPYIGYHFHLFIWLPKDLQSRFYPTDGDVCVPCMSSAIVRSRKRRNKQHWLYYRGRKKKLGSYIQYDNKL